MIHDTPLGQAQRQIMFLAENTSELTSVHQTDHIFIYKVMALTCSIQALYDNNREVWFSSGLRSAGKHLQYGHGFWDDVNTLRNREKKTNMLLQWQETEGSRTLWSAWTPPGKNIRTKSFGLLVTLCYTCLVHRSAPFHQCCKWSFIVLLKLTKYTEVLMKSLGQNATDVDDKCHISLHHCFRGWSQLSHPVLSSTRHALFWDRSYSFVYLHPSYNKCNMM